MNLSLSEWDSSPKKQGKKWNSLQLTTTKTGGNIQLLFGCLGIEKPPEKPLQVPSQVPPHVRERTSSNDVWRCDNFARHLRSAPQKHESSRRPTRVDWVDEVDWVDFWHFSFYVFGSFCVPLKPLIWQCVKLTLKLICREQSIISYIVKQTRGETHRSYVGKLAYSHCQISKMCVATWGLVYSQAASAQSILGIEFDWCSILQSTVSIWDLDGQEWDTPRSFILCKDRLKDVKLARTSSKNQEPLEKHTHSKWPLEKVMLPPFLLAFQKSTDTKIWMDQSSMVWKIFVESKAHLCQW